MGGQYWTDVPGSGLVYPGYRTRAQPMRNVYISQENLTVPEQCQNVPSFLIEHGPDEVSQTGIPEYDCFTEFRTCFTECGTSLPG